MTIQFFHVSRQASNGVKILDNICLSIKTGSWIEIKGVNQVGKTSLLKMIACEDTADSGTLKMDQQLFENMDRKQLRIWKSQIGLVFQDIGFFPDKSVLDNLMTPFLIQKNGGGIFREQLNRALERVHLREKMYMPMRDLSFSEQRLVVFLRALFPKRQILLLDDPFQGIEMHTIEVLQSILAEQHHQGVTIVGTVLDDTVFQNPHVTSETIEWFELTSSQIQMIGGNPT